MRSNDNKSHITIETNLARKRSFDWVGFRAHLLKIYESESRARSIQENEEIDEHELLTFGAQLFDIRQKWIRKLEDIGNRIPKDHPVRCPIGLFSAMDYGRLETAQTRVLAWLLNPEGEHDFGKIIARAFVSLVTGKKSEFGISYVASELPLVTKEGSTSGRSDIWLEASWLEESKTTKKQFLILTEAKIDSGLGDEQLERYESHLGRKYGGWELYRVFLTPDGHRAESSTEDWKPISFLELAKELIIAGEKVKSAPGYQFLQYYISGILHEIVRLPCRFHQDSVYQVLKKLEFLTQ